VIKGAKLNGLKTASEIKRAKKSAAIELVWGDVIIPTVDKGQHNMAAVCASAFTSYNNIHTTIITRSYPYSNTSFQILNADFIHLLL